MGAEGCGLNNRGNPLGPERPATAFRLHARDLAADLWERAPRVGLRGRPARVPALPDTRLPPFWPGEPPKERTSSRANGARAAETLRFLRAHGEARPDAPAPQRVSQPRSGVSGCGAEPRRHAGFNVPATPETPASGAPWKIRGQCNPPLAPSAESKAFRREVYRVRGTSRRLTRNANHEKCGCVRIGPQVAIIRNAETGRCSFGGLATCGLVWECLPCSTKIRVERARELQDVVAWHCEERSPESAQLLTLTVRHRYGDELHALRTGLANAWRRFTRDARFARFKARVGVVGYVRALEVTHGGNGWHPHLHIVLLVKHPEQLAMERAWLVQKWESAVVDELGHAPEPNAQHGVDLRACHKADYLAKLGLEIAAPSAKRSARGNRTPFEIVGDIDAPQLVHDERSDDERYDERAESIHLWKTWCEDMKGARMLTWSRGLRAAAGLLEERDDEEIAAEAEGKIQVTLVSADGWSRVGPLLRSRLLDAAERGGEAAVLQLLRSIGPP